MGQAEIVELLKTTGYMLDAKTLAKMTGSRQIHVSRCLRQLYRFKIVECQPISSQALNTKEVLVYWYVRVRKI